MLLNELPIEHHKIQTDLVSITNLSWVYSMYMNLKTILQTHSQS